MVNAVLGIFFLKSRRLDVFPVPQKRRFLSLNVGSERYRIPQQVSLLPGVVPGRGANSARFRVEGQLLVETFQVKGVIGVLIFGNRGG